MKILPPAASAAASESPRCSEILRTNFLIKDARRPSTISLREAAHGQLGVRWNERATEFSGKPKPKARTVDNVSLLQSKESNKTMSLIASTEQSS